MTAYPAAGDYYKAVQAPARVFTVPKLQAAEFVWDSLGPTLARGSSAVVFQAAVDGKPRALRCYIRNDASSRDRYSALDAYLAAHDLSPYVSGTTWLDGAIQVNRATWPVLTMDWIDGRTLNEYVDFLVASSNAAALTTLAAKWRALVALLQSSDFAHGDLQHGNVMVDQDGTLRLVDFDGVWIPQLAGQSPPTEFGHPNYQHPGQHVWDRWLDTFSALVIYLSLVALGKDPALWLALYNSKNLLFAKNDFFPPFKTEAWKQLAAMGDPQVDELVRRLQECCDPDWVSNQSLEMTLDQQAVTPARQPIPVEQRWWERQPVAAAGSAAAAPAAGGPASRPRSPETPSAAPPVAASSPPASPAPLGSAPLGSAPLGSAPLGSAPSGSAPSGSAPSGSAPSGSAPSGSAPSGSAPSGSAPSRVSPTRVSPTRVSPIRVSPTQASTAGRRLVRASAVGRRGHGGGAGPDSQDRDGFAAGPASAVRPARPGGYRPDAETEPDDGASGRHHLVVRTGGGVRPARAGPLRIPGVRAPRAGAARAGSTAAGTARAARRRRSRSRDRPPGPSHSASGFCC